MIHSKNLGPMIVSGRLSNPSLSFPLLLSPNLSIDILWLSHISQCSTVCIPFAQVSLPSEEPITHHSKMASFRSVGCCVDVVLSLFTHPSFSFTSNSRHHETGEWR